MDLWNGLSSKPKSLNSSRLDATCEVQTGQGSKFGQERGHQAGSLEDSFRFVSFLIRKQDGKQMIRSGEPFVTFFPPQRSWGHVQMTSALKGRGLPKIWPKDGSLLGFGNGKGVDGPENLADIICTWPPIPLSLSLTQQWSKANPKPPLPSLRSPSQTPPQMKWEWLGRSRRRGQRLRQFRGISWWIHMDIQNENPNFRSHTYILSTHGQSMYQRMLLITSWGLKKLLMWTVTHSQEVRLRKGWLLHIHKKGEYT